MAPAVETVDQEWKGLYKWGGIAWMITGLGAFVVIGLSVPLVSSLTSSQSALNNLAGQATIAQIGFGLDDLLPLFVVPAALALYFALKGVNRSAIIAAASFHGLFAILHLAIGPNYLSLVTLSQDYLASTSSAQSAAYVAAANYVFATDNVAFSVVLLVGGIAVLISGLVMLKGVFSKPVGYLGIAAGVLGIVAGPTSLVPTLLIVEVIFVLLVAVWDLLVGYRLYRLGRH